MPMRRRRCSNVPDKPAIPYPLTNRRAGWGPKTNPASGAFVACDCRALAALLDDGRDLVGGGGQRVLGGDGTLERLLHLGSDGRGHLGVVGRDIAVVGVLCLL